MTDEFLNNILNQLLWTYIKVNQSIIYSCPDNTFSWAPQCYLLPVYLYENHKNSDIVIIKQELTIAIQNLTGLKSSKIKICFYPCSSLKELK